MLALLLWMVSAALLNAQSVPKVAEVEGVSEYRLENGARVLLFPAASQPTVTVNMTVLVGSRHEGYGEAGMAHLLEHMVFKGTPTFEDIPRALRDHGASFNGTTNRDRTNYFETLPATDENLEFAIRMEADRLVNSYIRHEDLLSEFSVVRNEFERGENSPQGVLRQRIMAAAFEWHNYGKSTIGNRSDIERVPIDNLQDFYRKYYQPDNVVMVITGRFEESRALELVNEYLGAIPRPERELDATYTEEPPQDGPREVVLRRVGDVGSIAAAFHMPAASHEDWAPLTILSSVLSEDKVGLLEQALVEPGLASSVSARADNAHDPGLFYFSVTPTEGNLQAARDKLLETIAGLATASFDEQAVNRARTRSQRDYERMLVDASSMSMMLSTASSLGDWRLLFLQRDRLQDVTVEDVNRVARTYFPEYNRTLGMFIPTDSPQRMQIPAVTSIADVVKDYTGGEAVAAGEAFDPSPENLESRINAVRLGGVQVGLLSKKNRGETVDLSLTLRYGNEMSLRDRTRAAAMLPAMLMAGTKQMDRQALQARMAELGVRISPGGGGRGRGRRGGGMGGAAGALSFSVSAKRSSLAEGIRLLGEILREPAFPEDEFDQMKTRMVDMLKSMKSQPAMLAAAEMSRAMSQYPRGDVRYAPTVEETIEELESLTLEQIRQVYQQQLSSASGEIAVVGDFDQLEIMAALEEILADWPGQVEFAAVTREANPELTGSRLEIATPDMANAVFAAGLSFSLNDKDPDSEALQLGNFILGGGTLSSRLGDRIRQREGLSYGVSSSLSIPAEGTDARFSINAITNPANIGAVETAAMEELQRFIEEGPTEEEVSAAVTAWLERQKVSRARDGSIAGQIISNLYLDRSFRFVAEREARIAGLTAADIQAAFRKHIKPDKLVIIRAGDFQNP
jgi:zinc protease